MSNITKKSTAILLAALYGLVGLTGESLHYLSEDVGLAFRQLQIADSGGYFHSHQPDNHVHFHHHHGEEETAKVNGYTESKSDQNTRKVKPSKQFHNPHGCPLLTIVSQLKLSQILGYFSVVIPKTSQFFLGNFDLCHTISRVSKYYARGPPSIAFCA